MFTKVKTPAELEAMRESGRMLATVLQAVRPHVADGITTKDLALVAEKELYALGGTAPFKGYPGGPDSFPDVICISVNEQVVHGIPSPRKFVREGDIVSLDFGVKYRGMITDSAISVIAGKAKEQRHEDLVKYTEASMMAGIQTLHHGVKTGDIGAAVQAVLQSKKYGIVRDLVGHGVGHELHEDPNVPNYGRAGTGTALAAGMTIAIEPMATLGGERVVMSDDGWTIYTRDGSWAAHFEHSIAITDDGFEILTTL